MTVYALYVPTACRPVSGIAMEVFPSREVTGRMLLQRNATQHSKTFYVGAPKVSHRLLPEAEFPLADETGYMRVLLRKAADPVPALRDTPDEEWVVRGGGERGVVERLPWQAFGEKLTVDRRANRLTVTPAEVRPEQPKSRNVQCADPGCRMIFSGPPSTWDQFRDLFMKHGWRARGSVQGLVTYCPEHVP